MLGEKIKGFVFLGAIVLAAVAGGTQGLPRIQSASAEVGKDQSITEELGEKKWWGLETSILYNSSLHQLDSSDRRSSIDFSIIPSIQLAERIKLTISEVISKDLENEKKWSVSDLAASIRYAGWTLNPYLSFSPAIGGKLGLNEESVKGNSFQGSINIAPRLILNLERAISGLGMYFQMTATRNFHEFDRSFSGESNTQWSLGNRFTLYYDFLDAFEISVLFDRVFGWSYRGGIKHAYGLQEEIAYSITSDFSVAIGHTTEGSAVKENGIDNNIKIFDGQDSTIYTSATVKF